MGHLLDRKWVTCRESKSESKGRPVKIYKLSSPISEIMDSIEKEKKKEATNQLNLIKKLRDYIS
jgi:predicted transcriptional regulator